MRKEITSATLELEEIAALGIIAKREFDGNRSAALRAIVRQEAERRGLLALTPVQPKVAEAQHV